MMNAEFKSNSLDDLNASIESLKSEHLEDRKREKFSNEIKSHLLELNSHNFNILNKNSSSSIVIKDKNDVQAVQLFAFYVCQEYLAGVWKSISVNDLKIQRISGGLTNYLYKCQIDDKKSQVFSNEPKQILLRLYGETHNNNSATILKDVVVSTIMSNYQLGPKLYGFFPNGRLEELIDASNMDQDDMYVPKLSREIAQVMARFHKLEMPFIKEPSWLFDTINKYIKNASKLTFTNQKDAKNYDKFKSYNLENEFDQLMPILEHISSPVVFCHNDINIGNILKLADKLMIIDYEYGSYNYRGFDLGNHFCEWMMNNNYEEHPYFQYNFDLYPNEQQQENFIEAYINELNECQTVFSTDNKPNYYSNLTVEDIKKEANHFALASNIFWAFWAVCLAPDCKIKFEYLEYALARCDAYFKLKNRLFPKGF